MMYPTQEQSIYGAGRWWVPACALLVLVCAGCSTFSPATSPEPEYYIDEFGMVHVPERNQRTGAYQLRPGFGRFSLSAGGGVRDGFYDPFYDRFARPQYGYQYPYYFGRPPGFAYFRPPPASPPQATVGPADPTGGMQGIPLASPATFIRNAPEPDFGPDDASRARAVGQRQSVNTRPSYGGGSRNTRPAGSRQRPRTARPAPSRPAPPPGKPRVIDP